MHCTVTRQLAVRAGYLREFTEFWSAQPHVRKIWFSLYTPQVGEESDEKLRPEDRERVVSDLLALPPRTRRSQMPRGLIGMYATPPTSPEECIFSRVTHTVSADLQTRITPCQFGGTPGLCELRLHRVGRAWPQSAATGCGGLIPIDPIFDASIGLGRLVRRWRERATGDTPAAATGAGGLIYLRIRCEH